MPSIFSRRVASTPANGDYSHAGVDEHEILQEDFQGSGLDKEYGKEKPAVHVRTVSANTSEADEAALDGRSWQAGLWARFPVLSLACLLVIIVCMAGTAVVLGASDGKSVDSWMSATIVYKNHRKTTHLGVSTWISIFNFVMGKALGAMYAEAVAVSWWVDAVQGQTLGLLHYRWEVGQSFTKILTRRRFMGWICVASIAAVAFSALDSLLQQSSTSVTALINGTVPMTLKTANALPAGFSGVLAAQGHDWYTTRYSTPLFTQIVQNYTVNTPVNMGDITGCPATSNGFCAVSVPGIGFQYECAATRREVGPLETFYNSTTDNSTSVVPNPITVLGVNFTGGFTQSDSTQAQEPWTIELSAIWKDGNGSDGDVLSYRHCTLTPALVEYPLNVTDGVATLGPVSTPIEWSSVSADSDKTSILSDKVIKTLPVLAYDVSQNRSAEPVPGTHTTIGGITLAFSNIFGSSIVMSLDVVTQQFNTDITGAFAAQHAAFPQGTGAYGLNNTFGSPMADIVSNIRDIMFRSSVAIVQDNVKNYVLEDSTGSAFGSAEHLSSTGPTTETTVTGEFHVFETVYKTNFLYMGISLGLMSLALAAILPLYYGFWKLGRKMSLAPIELARAFYNAHAADADAGVAAGRSVLDAPVQGSERPPQSGSNLPTEELVDLLGEKKVQYGEVQPGVLGMGIFERTNAPRKGVKYQ